MPKHHGIILGPRTLSTMRFLRMPFPLVSIGSVLGALECFSDLRIPELTQNYLQYLLFLGKTLPSWSTLYDHDLSHLSFWPSFLLLSSIFPFKDRRCLLLTSLFCFAKLSPFNLRRKKKRKRNTTLSIFFGKKHLNEYQLRIKIHKWESSWYK